MAPVQIPAWPVSDTSTALERWNPGTLKPPRSIAGADSDKKKGTVYSVPFLLGWKRLTGSVFPENLELQPSKLLESSVGCHHSVSAGQRKGGEVCVHPDLGRSGIAHRETLPVSLQPGRFFFTQYDPVVGKKGLVALPGLPIREG